MNFDLSTILKDYVHDEFKIAIEEIMNDEKAVTNIDFILQLCQLITSQIDIVIKKHYFRSSGTYVNLYNRKNDIDEAQEEKLMVFGAQLIYALRKFINKEEIIFHMATRTSKKSYKASAFVSQSEIMSQLSAVSKKAVGVSTAIKNDLINKNQYNAINKIKRQNLWTQVEYLAEPWVDFETSNKIDVNRKEGEPHWAYQSLKRDMMVYISFHGKNANNYIKYYDKTGQGSLDSLMVFNNGWLWQWYNKVLYGGTDEEYLWVNDSIMSGSLRPIIMEPDYVRGTKEGDFQDLYKRQIQSKYDNNKIISYNNIRHVIYELQVSLIAYKSQEEGATQKLLDVLQEHFFPESVTVGNHFVNDIADELLAQLNAKKS